MTTDHVLQVYSITTILFACFILLNTNYFCTTNGYVITFAVQRQSTENIDCIHNQEPWPIFDSVNCLQAQNEINYSILVLDSLVYLTSASVCSNGLITAAWIRWIWTWSLIPALNETQNFSFGVFTLLNLFAYLTSLKIRLFTSLFWLCFEK